MWCILYLHQITIFGAKILIFYVFLSFIIAQKLLLLFWAYKLKFAIFWKLNLWTQFQILKKFCWDVVARSVWLMAFLVHKFWWSCIFRKKGLVNHKKHVAGCCPNSTHNITRPRGKNNCQLADDRWQHSYKNWLIFKKLLRLNLINILQKLQFLPF